MYCFKTCLFRFLRDYHGDSVIVMSPQFSVFNRFPWCFHMVPLAFLRFPRVFLLIRVSVALFPNLDFAYNHNSFGPDRY